MAKKYNFNKGDKVTYVLVGGGFTNYEPHTVTKVKGDWCWLEGSEDSEWSCYHRMNGNAKENNIPGFSSHLEIGRAKCQLEENR